MSQKIAVAVTHGLGNGEPKIKHNQVREPNFLTTLKENLFKQFQQLGLSEAEVNSKFEFVPIYWAPVLQVPQNKLWQKLKQGNEMRWLGLREYLLSFVSDAVAYQPTPHKRHVYDAMHGVFSQALHKSAVLAGEKAPLCVISHSLGTVIAENYFYELQVHYESKGKNYNFINPVLRLMGNTPIERGETLSLFYTMGSPLALWTVRDPNFGQPIQFPPPKLSTHHPNIQPEWVNFYDKDDVIGFPLKSINEAYNQAVTQDKQVNVGGWTQSWNPMSHNNYWTDDRVNCYVAEALVSLWNRVN
ncbi:hypothetical protein M595_0985 [Lyngbya aestuarii BL J]|uniref:Chemotaxis protein n=1 Tax=Lyngbya aestuarii BL J TaxID=1348334 RepID=U7QRA7_9CYAN|nr:hypothetical protein [Lyngbya aestuarii]ERT08936.1 hypothetical protein M595_0985 [Lyngbya aestuarii BL J]